MDALPDSADVGRHAQVLAAGNAEDPVALVDRAACSAPAGGGTVPLDRRQAAKDAAALQSLEDVRNLPDDDRYLAMVLARVMQAREEDFGHVLRTQGALPDAQAVVGHLGDPGFLRLALAYEVGAANLVGLNRSWLPKPPSTRKRQGARLREGQLAKLPPGRHSDNDGFGLHAHVRKKGRVRWIARITCGFLAPREKPRKRGGKTVVVKECPRVDFPLGRWPATSLQAARETAAEYFGLVQKGVDPRVELMRSTLTLSEAWKEALPKKARKARWKDGMNGPSAEDYARTFRRHVQPTLGERPAAAITPVEIENLIEELVERHAAVPVKAMLALHLVFDWVQARGLRADHPSRIAAKVVGDIAGYNGGVPWTPVAEASRAYRLICAYGGPAASRSVVVRRNALRMVVLTLKRPIEVLRLRWEDIDLENRLLRIPKERMKGRLPKADKSGKPAAAGAVDAATEAVDDPREDDKYHLELLPDEALEILLEMRPRGPATGLVFCVEGGRGRRVLKRKELSSIMRDLELVGSTHGWRKTFRTWADAVAQQKSENTELIRALAEMVLAHKIGSHIQRLYNKELSLEGKLALQERWIKYLHTGPNPPSKTDAVEAGVSP